MPFLGTLIIILIVYMAYQIGRIKGKAEVILQTGRDKKKSTDRIEEAEYEEIK